MLFTGSPLCPIGPKAHSCRGPFPTEHLPVTGVTDADTEPIGECPDNLTTPSTILPLLMRFEGVFLCSRREHSSPQGNICFSRGRQPADECREEIPFLSAEVEPSCWRTPAGEILSEPKGRAGRSLRAESTATEAHIKNPIRVLRAIRGFFLGPSLLRVRSLP